MTVRNVEVERSAVFFCIVQLLLYFASENLLTPKCGYWTFV